MTAVKKNYSQTPLPMPDRACIPVEYRADVQDLFDTWHALRGRNSRIDQYMNMRIHTKNLGISVPPNMEESVNAVVGWARTAVNAMAVRSRFDGYNVNGHSLPELDELVHANAMDELYDVAMREAMAYGVSFVTVMAGGEGQPAAKVRSYSANQACGIWDGFADRLACGITLAGVDRKGRATRYVLHEPDETVTFTRDNATWTAEVETHNTGRPLMEPLVFERDDDRPLGHSRITPEIMGIIDKAMRDVLRMEVGAEFFTAPQRYILGADDDLFDGDTSKFKAYMGQFLALTKDEDGDVPQVGQFSPGDPRNFVQLFENDAQRFSGATHVPVAQLGVLSSTYTSSDALNATNDPLILDVKRMNVRMARSMESIGRLMLAVSRGERLGEVMASEDGRQLRASMPDPAMLTLGARVDAWVKIGSMDSRAVGTDFWYEQMGVSKPDRARLKEQLADGEKRERLRQLREQMTAPVAKQDAAQPLVAAQMKPNPEQGADHGSA